MSAGLGTSRHAVGRVCGRSAVDVVEFRHGGSTAEGWQRGRSGGLHASLGRSSRAGVARRLAATRACQVRRSRSVWQSTGAIRERLAGGKDLMVGLGGCSKGGRLRGVVMGGGLCRVCAGGRLPRAIRAKVSHPSRRAPRAGGLGLTLDA